jgi:hypothetical protein
MKTCPRCAAPNADEAASCSGCGAMLAASPSEAETAWGPSQAPPPPGTAWGPPQGPPPGTSWGPPQAPPPRTPATAFKLDVERWPTTDRVAGGATLVLFIALFLPWFTYGGQSVDGLWHGYEYLTLIIALGIIAYLIARAALPSLPFNNTVPHDRLLLAATAVNLLLVLIGFLARPSASAFFITVTADWGVGAYFGLIAALVAVAAAASPVVTARTRR